VGVRAFSNTEPGWVLTRPMDARTKRLTVNAFVNGELRAELRYGNNKIVEGFALDDCDPLAASGFANEITWGGKAIGAAEEPEVHILFEMKETQLFTFSLE